MHAMTVDMPHRQRELLQHMPQEAEPPVVVFAMPGGNADTAS